MIKDIEQFCDIVDGMNDEWELVQKDTYEGKHDCTNYTALIKNRQNGTFHILDWDVSYNDGIDPGDCLEFPMNPPLAEITEEKIHYVYRLKK